MISEERNPCTSHDSAQAAKPTWQMVCVYAMCRLVFQEFRFRAEKAYFGSENFRTADNSVQARRNWLRHGPSDVHLRALRSCPPRKMRPNARSPPEIAICCSFWPPRPASVRTGLGFQDIVHCSSKAIGGKDLWSVGVR